MNLIDFFLGMAACAVIVGVWRAIKDSRKSEQEFKSKVESMYWKQSTHSTKIDIIESNCLIFNERLERLEKRRK
jgi:hypothetical protein